MRPASIHKASIHLWKLPQQCVTRAQGNADANKYITTTMLHRGEQGYHVEQHSHALTGSPVQCPCGWCQEEGMHVGYQWLLGGPLGTAAHQSMYLYNMLGCLAPAGW